MNELKVINTQLIVIKEKVALLDLELNEIAELIDGGDSTPEILKYNDELIEEKRLLVEESDELAILKGLCNE